MWSPWKVVATRPRWLTRPKVALTPTMPQYAAGVRTEPPMSVPREAKVMPAATLAAPPPLEPAGMWSVFQGLRTVPKCGLSDVPPAASSCMFSLPRMTAPAFRYCCTAKASSVGT